MPPNVTFKASPPFVCFCEGIQRVVRSVIRERERQGREEITGGRKNARGDGWGYKQRVDGREKRDKKRKKRHIIKKKIT